MAKRGLFMTKKDMAKAIADETGLTHGQATEVILARILRPPYRNL